MISHGTRIINKKTNTTHVVDGIEVINGESLVFTKDIKCFPISEVRRIESQNIQLSYSDSKNIIGFTNSLIQVLHYDLPLVEKKPSFLEKLFNKFF
jgi:hypothetical protein